MRIKRVVIQGFKTFARRTDFVFDPGVTAVVGPNGSGKSNIVDAIRWCLGEQSFSLLRSRKTSDVIFAGSDKKARLNLAEVTITLDNSAGEIPIDFTEVEITRRAYRDGDNEYLVNGQRVRLQDITELLSQTGLGKRTYSVVGQGLIDRALSMAPEERRSLFEEAAGITGYQIKRATAVRRLEATQQNLVRIQDIVAELSPRLGYLRRQADRAREREQIARDLQALLREWYGYRWHTTLKQLEEHHAAELQLRAEVDQRTGELAAIGTAIEAVRASQGDLRSRLAVLHNQGSELHRQAEAAGREVAVAQERLRQLYARQEDNRRELAPLRVQQESLGGRLADLHAAVADAETDLAGRQQAVEAVQLEVGQRQQERARLQEELDTARRAVKRIQEERADTASRLKQLDERRDTILREQSDQQNAVAAAQQEISAAEAELRRAETGSQALDQEAQRVREQVSALEQNVTTRQAELRQGEESRQLADRALDRLQTRFDLLKRLSNEGAGYGSGVRTVLQASKAGRLQGIVGTVASQVHVPPHLDKAIETALGGALQNIVTTSWHAATQAIEFLKAQRGGRATFLPLDRLNVLPAIAAPHVRGILGNAAELVTFDPAVSEAVQQLLNRVWIAEDLAAARAALDALSGPRPTVVTLDGEIIRPGGAVTGGSEGNRGDDSLLARERELRELPAEIEAATTAAQRAAAVCSELSGELERARVEIERQQRELAELARRDRQQRQQMEDLRRRVDRSRQAHRWHHEQLERTEAELNTLAANAQSLAAQLAELQQTETASNEQLSRKEAEVNAAGADNLLQELANRRAAAAEVQGHLRSQHALLESTGRTLQSVKDQIAHKEALEQQLASEIEALAGQTEELSRREHALSSQLSALQDEIQPLEAELARLEAQQAGAENQERQLQQMLRKDESAWNQAQLHLQRSEDQLHQLRNEIEQDLGLVALEASDDVAYQPPLPWDAFVQQLPVLESIPESLGDEVREMRARLARLSNVNPEAPREYEEAATRYEFLYTQAEDLEAATADLQKVIKELDERMEVELRRTYEAVGKEFTRFFQLLFNGGTAHLELTDPENISTSGVEIIARPPGKRPQSLALLSGGERSLAACALIFAILHVSPTPFCVLDEVDAALDEANVDRFRATLEDLSGDTQFIVVTHNRRTLEGANTIYGVTMGNDGISRVISLRLEGDRMVKYEEGPDAGSGDAADLKALEEEIKL